LAAVMNSPVFLVVVEIRTEYQRFPARSSPNEIISAPVEDTRRVGLFAGVQEAGF